MNNWECFAHEVSFVLSSSFSESQDVQIASVSLRCHELHSSSHSTDLTICALVFVLQGLLWMTTMEAPLPTTLDRMKAKFIRHLRFLSCEHFQNRVVLERVVQWLQVVPQTTV